MKNKLISILLLICIFSATSCKKDEIDSNSNNDNDNDDIEVTAAKSFKNIIFTTTTPYFSTDGSMTEPVDSNVAKTIVSKIDITFIYDYSEPGFFDPVARSQEWYWDSFYKPWLSDGVETKYYSTTLSYSQFLEAKNDQSKIASYFSDTSVVKIAPHGIFPTGTCIGGRQTYDPSSVKLYYNRAYGFKNVVSGKKGFIFIVSKALFTDTIVDIIIEN